MYRRPHDLGNAALHDKFSARQRRPRANEVVLEVDGKTAVLDQVLKFRNSWPDDLRCITLRANTEADRLRLIEVLPSDHGMRPGILIQAGTLRRKAFRYPVWLILSWKRRFGRIPNVRIDLLPFSRFHQR